MGLFTLFNAAGIAKPPLGWGACCYDATAIRAPAAPQSCQTHPNRACRAANPLGLPQQGGRLMR